MVGPEEVDAELAGEVTSECSKYGKVADVTVYTEPGTDAVKIFVKFETPEGGFRSPMPDEFKG